MRWFFILFFVGIASRSWAHDDSCRDLSYSMDVKSNSKPKKIDLAICTIFQNESRFLKEWIEYHRLLGVQMFYLYDNHNTDNYLEVLKPYIKNKIVKLIDWNMPGFNQIEAYRDGIRRAIKNKVKWLAVIDSDEFIVPIHGNNLGAFLKQYEEFGGIAVNWQMYGTSHVYEIPSTQLLIESLLYKARENYSANTHIKSIIQPERTIDFNDPHTCRYQPPYFQVNENKEPFYGPYSPYVSVNKICINHYWTRDEKFLFESKIPRRNNWGEPTYHIMQCAQEINVEIPEKSPILRFVPALRSALGYPNAKD